MRYGISPVGNVMDKTGIEAQEGAVAQLLAKLPGPLQVLVQILIVILIAAVIGAIIGKMYAAIKYPDPEKHHIISPKLKVLFICILAACCFWLYATMTREEPSEMVPEIAEGQEGQSESLENGSDMPVGISNGKTASILR